MRQAKKIAIAVLALALFATAPVASASSPAKRRKAAAAIIRQAADETRAEGSAHVDGEIRIESEQTGSIAIGLDGDIDLGAEGDGQLTMHAPAELFGFDADIEMRVVDQVVYMNFGDLLALAGEDLPIELEGRPWVSLDASDLAAGGESLAPGGSSGNPAGELDALRGLANGSVDTVGPDEIDGVATTHYRAVVDLTKAQREVPEAYREQFEQATALFGDSLSNVPVDVWIDNQGRVRRQRLRLDLDTGKVSLSEIVQMSYSDFGVDIAVDVPPVEETIGYQEFVALANDA